MNQIKTALAYLYFLELVRRQLKFNFLSLNTEAVSCLDRAVNIFCDIGRLSMAARYLKVYIHTNIYIYIFVSEYLANAYLVICGI